MQEIPKEHTSLNRRARVLSFGYLADQLRDRSRRLKEAGFIVDASSDPDEGLEMAGTRRYDCVVFGISVPEKIRNAIAAEARRRHSKTVIVMLYWKGIENAELADAVLNISTSGDELHHILDQLVSARRLSGLCR